ncbi:hypothetical protein SDJN02_20275, partial [Cucurbita argyrosperma subsp. argyrosperma]
MGEQCMRNGSFIREMFRMEKHVEIRCRGQEVLPFWTLADVRDRIWCSSSSDSPITFSPHSSTLNHLMLLHYGRKD